MIAFDLHVQMIFRDNLLLYRRFVDDVLIIARNFDLERFMFEANAWNSSICITHDDTEQGHTTNFLDLTLEIKDSYVKYSTYRKPMNTYQYTPFNSSCAKHVKQGILESEFRRMLRTNLFQSDYDRQVLFFSEKLRDRAFPAELVSRYVCKFQWQHKFDVLSKHASATSKTVVPLKFNFALGLEDLRIGACLNKAASVLPSWFGDHHSFVVCYTAQPNLFRRRYSRFL